MLYPTIIRRMKKPSCQIVLLFFWFLNLDLITFSFSFAVNTSAHLCSYDQRHALMDFKKSFTINPDASINRDFIDSYFDEVLHGCSPSSPPRTNSWNEGQDCCYWDGVTCDTITGQVIGLDLDCSWLRGQLSSNNSLFLLHHLQILNLAYNDFIGSEIPPTFSHFRRLTHLNLSHSYFSGEIPIRISYLSNLVSLDLSDVVASNIVGTGMRLTRVTMKSIVQNLTNIKEFHLGNVDLSLVGSDSLRNISSSLIFLVLTGLNGIFPTSIFHLQNLQLLRLSGGSGDLQVSLPTSNWSTTSLTELRFSLVNFKNRLPSSIGNLKSLKYLSIDFSGNTGSIPDSIGNLTSLVRLSLTVNNLVGIIPPSLAYLTHLEYLDLSYNQLVGSIPNFSNLSLLHTIHLSYNLLNQTIPSSLFNLPSLLYLDLSYNQLVGGVPEFRSTSLHQIDLSHNRLQGSIPNSISNLAKMTELYFSSNNLSGVIDTSMFSKLQSLLVLDGSNNTLSYTTSLNLNHSLPNLEHFDFSSNNMTEFPTFLRGSKALSYLDLSKNKIYGRVPNWLWNVGRDTLFYLNLASNKFTRIHKLSSTSLRYLDLRSNLLRGPLLLPPHKLVAYFISNNSLTGDIPILICNASFMKAFDLSMNSFTGTIPECLGNITTLSVLDLSMNSLHGRIPNFYGHEERRSLKTLNLNGNQLEGKLPISLVNCKKLEVLDIGSNNINDTFPHWLQFLTELQVLVLKSNNFHGYIHDYKCSHNFQKLKILDISNNNFVGSLPTKYIQGLEDMQSGINGSNYMTSYYRGRSYYKDSISLIIKGTEIKFEKILTTFMTIDFSNNNFKGEIPQVIGTLIFLKSLNLSNNHLVGHIPSSIGNLLNLESLDLSSNKLTGTIPRELASITFLGKLNLSHNTLVGPIPSANHFDTRFDNNSYQENLALCGPPLSRTCSNDNNKKPPTILLEEKGSDEFDRKIILYGYVSGLVIGFSIGYMVLSIELPIWLVKMIQRYKLRKLKGEIQRSRGRRRNQ